MAQLAPQTKGPGYMRLSWNEIGTRAARFAQEWQDAGYEKGQTQLFYRDFFDIFGVPVRRVAAFEQPVKLLGAKRGFIDLFWKGVLLVEQKSTGRDLTKAKTQALSYFPGLKDADLPRYILLSDFETFELYDLDEDESVAFALADLPQHVEKFGSSWACRSGPSATRCSFRRSIPPCASGSSTLAISIGPTSLRRSLARSFSR